LRPAGPIIVLDLFAPERQQLLELLRSLSTEDWAAPTACAGWLVKDVALHLLGGDIGVLSRKRDSFDSNPRVAIDDLVAYVDGLNARWVEATRRMSPRLLCDLLDHLGSQVLVYWRSVDPFGPGERVSWAGGEESPAWMDMAREYTERWMHQQHIRDAVGRPGLTERRFFAPVLDAFVRALPRTFENVERPSGTTVLLTITGEAGGTWTLAREPGGWSLYVEPSAPADASVELDQDTAWRLFTKGLSPQVAGQRARLAGDDELARRALETIAIIG
jgi:uncharacterized protein (TIGR03083 family)